MWWLAAIVACSGGDEVEPLEAARQLVEAGEEVEAAAALEPLCEAGDVDACALRAELSVGPDEVRLGAAERACEASLSVACLLRSEAPGDRWDQAACEAGDGPACQRAAEGAVEDRSRGRWAGQACHLGVVEACLPAAVEAWRQGQGGRAVSLASVRCAARDGDVACAVADGWKQAQAGAQRCDDGDASACVDACEAGMTCASEVLATACEAGDGRACRLVALGGSSEAEELLWRACDEVDAVDPWACLILADRVAAGAPLPAGARGGVAWLRTQACDLQLDYGCPSHAGW